MLISEEIQPQRSRSGTKLGTEKGGGGGKGLDKEEEERPIHASSRISHQISRGNHICGTLAYLAPEQMEQIPFNQKCNLP